MARDPMTGQTTRPVGRMQDQRHNDELMNNDDTTTEVDELMHAAHTPSPVSPVRAPGHDTPAVNVYDTKPDAATSPTSPYTSTPPASSGAGMVSWVLGAIVLIVVLYFLFQWLF